MNDQFIVNIKKELLGKDDQTKAQILTGIHQWVSTELNKLNDKCTTPYIERVIKND